MLSGLERHVSVVSLLLLAGAGLIILEGPVGSHYLHQLLTPKTVEKVAPKATDSQANSESEKQATATINLSAPSSTWVNTMDNAAPLHSTLLGEIPVNDRFTPDAASK